MTPADAAGCTTTQTRSTARSSVAVRTCIGCRRREARSSLLRIAIDATQPPSTAVRVVLPDPAGRLPGRGAWVHPTTSCLDKAERRRAAGRALRLTSAVDLSRVRDYVETWELARGEHDTQDDQIDHRLPVGGAEKRTESGFDADESPMSTQQ